MQPVETVSHNETDACVTQRPQVPRGDTVFWGTPGEPLGNLGRRRGGRPERRGPIDSSMRRGVAPGPRQDGPPGGRPLRGTAGELAKGWPDDRWPGRGRIAAAIGPSAASFKILLNSRAAVERKVSCTKREEPASRTAVQTRVPL